MNRTLTEYICDLLDNNAPMTGYAIFVRIHPLFPSIARRDYYGHLQRMCNLGLLVTTQRTNMPNLYSRRPQ